ncbi:hypothetical protein P154DRAFT_432430 [Amniculicola lignicola CBS 123094]|uniref:protein-tyrosine-phosphatase n=1 Tax=Amniculicola lignicola CBS 123094 TaxID=1392246 RepID=A0A6A5WJV0_9PLEO|nr:hypothetical protein P154DRAFT_432430 [Amniculicola lignicola CBS 123094]
MDSSSVTDPSPGPSPESPVAKSASTSFVADFRSRRGDTSADPTNAPFFELQRPTTPAKKPRNLKNLGINTASSLGNLRSNATSTLPALSKKEKNTSAPTSPSFIKPPTPPKRRPSNLSLTIQTPGTDSKPMRLMIPSTPAMNRPALRHFQSSPSLPLCSPNAIGGGMQLPALRPIKTNPHGFAEVPIEIEEEDQEQNFDVPQSREEKPAAYPNGAICIYESGVYLYFEPTAEQACSYDVIINVASEVKNPFTSPVSASQKELDARRIDGPPAENVDFAALPERTKGTSFDTQSSSPTTPRATPVVETAALEQYLPGTNLKIPEYIHMPWEHNTDIVPDLFKLVKLMDERVQQGKRILVHCQCGVSRSASLIVAYGLYKNPGISVQEAYDAVKKRSKWIGPNMNLIMQLQEFRGALLKANEPTRSFGIGTRRSAGLPSAVSTGTNRRSPFETESSSIARTPRTAPLPAESDINNQRASTGNIMAISPGPLSAPTNVTFSPNFRRSWASSQTHFDLSPKTSPTTLPNADPKGAVVPVLSISDNHEALPASQVDKDAEEMQQDTISKPHPVPNFSRQLPLRPHFGHGSSSDDDAPMSPTSGGFASVPFGFDSLRSPTASGFNIAPLQAPTQATFSLPPWQRSEHGESRVAPMVFAPEEQQSLVSPRSTEFHMTGLHRADVSDSYGLRSPHATGFDLSPALQSGRSSKRSSGSYEITSPTATQFPTDIFPRVEAPADVEMLSPRATEFHMTPLAPRVADVDPFGLTSPKQFEFPQSSFEKLDLAPPNAEPEIRRPSFQAILPPSNIAQLETENGFASLNGTAKAPVIPKPAPLESLESFAPVVSSDRVDSLSTPPLSQPEEFVEPHTPGLGYGGPVIQPNMTPSQTFLATPTRQMGVKTRFSSPNLRQQRKLHKLQTEIEALLPNRSPQLQQSTDDLDALMSPRAEEFTRNPFHIDFRAATDDNSPASSNETIKESQIHKEWKDTPPLTPPRALDEDPRSPVQTGSSPIVRNIWDVL